MPECWICGRATVTESVLPLNICDRARCKPEKDILGWKWSRELAKEYYQVERAVS